MRVSLKKLSEQVIVITGATSGIGLVTARMAAKGGARLLLAARSFDALRQLEKELRELTEVMTVAADVGKEDEVERIAHAALQRFGGFDTWVNNAAVTVYGELLDIPIADQRRLFDTNLWGVIYGSRAACRHLVTNGGALINIGSVLSDRAVPLQGIYSASKHAVKGYTDALRMELQKRKAPISVTLIKPSAIATPYHIHGRNYMDVEPKPPAPVYAPEAVAEAILHCAQHPEREIYIGSGGKFLASLGMSAPRLTDKYMQAAMFRGQRTEEEKRPHMDALYTSGFPELHERGRYEGYVMESSFYAKAQMHPIIAGAIALSAVGLAMAWMNARREEHEEAA